MTQNGTPRWSKKNRTGRRPIPLGKPNRKAQARLDARLKDYVAMTARVDFKANDGSAPAFHRPGSMKVYG